MSEVATQAEYQRRFLRVFCWLCLILGTVALLAAWLVTDLAPHRESPLAVTGMAAAYAVAVWVLMGSRHEFRARHATALLAICQVALILMLTTMHPAASAIGVLSYLILPILLAGFLLPAWSIWATLGINSLVIVVFAISTQDSPEMVRMSATRAFIAQVTAAAAVWFFATRVAGLLRHQERRLEEKRVLLQEIHHRVKNNLQIISSLLGLQGARSSHPEVRSATEQSQRRILAMAAAHDAVYGNAELGRVNLPRYLEEVIRTTEQAAGTQNVSITSELAPVELSMKHAIPLGLILGELLMNALKHAFPDQRAGTIQVTLTKATDGIHLLVRDNGVGFPQHTLDGAESLGFALVHALTEQVGGAVAFEETSGAEVKFFMPIEADPE